MSSKFRKKDFIWSYLGQFLYTGINIVLLPFVLKYLPANELGLWYTFTSIGALANLLDFGFKTTITRNVAYAWGGATKLPKENENLISDSDEPNINLLKKVINVSSKLYLIIGLLAIISLLTFGTLYIKSVTSDELINSGYMFAWYVYAFSIFFQICFAYLDPLLKGVGAIKESYQSMVISKVVYLIVAVLGLLSDYKLIAIAVGLLISSLAGRVASNLMFNNYIKSLRKFDEISNTKVSFNSMKETFLVMWPNAYKQGFMSLANYLTDKSVILITSYAYGLKVSASLGLTLQLFSVVATVGNVLFNSLMPHIIHMRMKKEDQVGYNMFSISVGVQAILIFLGGLCIVFLADPLLKLIGSNSATLPIFESSLILIYIYVFNHHQICSSYIIANNEMPMYKSYLITGVLTIFCTMLSTYFFKNSLGIQALLIPQLLLQLLYNGWRWPLYIANKLDKRFFDIYFDALKNMKKLIKAKKFNINEGRM